ncbi:PASTA domain-containing protein [Euzebya sp.]|uniref:Stk1 family PASTA domain-containing Ser/Thr kinase n=1 Tax=Euzebya sp. TaxID=1971409 RepID=UPI0035120351
MATTRARTAGPVVDRAAGVRDPGMRRTDRHLLGLPAARPRTVDLDDTADLGAVARIVYVAPADGSREARTMPAPIPAEPLPVEPKAIGVIVVVLAIIAGILLATAGGPDAELVSDTPSVVPLPPEVAAPIAAGDQVRVPMDLIGEPLEDAIDELQASGLQAAGEHVFATADGRVPVVTGVAPRSGALVPAGSAVTLTAELPAAPSTPTPGPEASDRTDPSDDEPVPFAVELIAGSPAGSGCTPGPGPLPDGQWVVLVDGVDDAGIAVDLVCYDSATGTVTNESPQLRTVALAADAPLTCGDERCTRADLDDAMVAVLETRGGSARAVHVLLNG